MSLSELTEHVVAQGLTRARSPEAAVGQRLREGRDVIELPDGRFDSLGRMLHGVVQTYRVTPHARLVREVCPDDLALLMAAPGLRWLGGDPLDPWRSGWLPVPDLPAFAVGDLIGFRVDAGSVALERIAPDALLASAEREQIVVDELRRAAALSRGRYAGWMRETVTDPTPALVSLLRLDPTLLLAPMAPVTELIDRAGLPRDPVPRQERSMYDDIPYDYPPYRMEEPDREGPFAPLRLIGRGSRWPGGY